MASKEALRKSALAALQAWPRDPLRPNVQLRDVLIARYENKTPSSSSLSPSSPQGAAAEVAEVKAINALLSNQYKKKFVLNQGAYTSASGGIMRPASNPDYYETLVRDLDEVPTRTASQSWLIRLKGLFRFS